MKHAAVALFVLSTVVSLAGAYVRSGFIYAEEQPTALDIRAEWDFQKRLYIAFFVMAAFGLIFALTNVFAFSFLSFDDDGALWAVVPAGAWSIAVLLLFMKTFRVP